jgi:hypothetical protein
LVNHFAREAGVTTYYDGFVVRQHRLALGSVSRYKTHNIYWAQALCYAATDGATNS